MLGLGKAEKLKSKGQMWYPEIQGEDYGLVMDVFQSCC